MTAPFRHPLLPAGPGHRLRSTLDAIDRRNALLVDAGRRFFFGSDREIARRLHAAILRYQTGAWRRSRSDLTCRHQVGRLDAVLWQLLRLHDRTPSERLIRMALSRTASSRD